MKINKENCIICKNKFDDLDKEMLTESERNGYGATCALCKVNDASFIDTREKEILKSFVKDGYEYFSFKEKQMIKNMKSRAKAIIRDYNNAVEVKTIIDKKEKEES